jgi:hypothetical protein
MPLTTFTADTTAEAAEVNANFALTVLTDTSKTVTVTHTWTASQTFTGGFTTGASATLGGHLLFTDATYDIGASGATRPRDFHLSRNALIGGTLGITGTTTAAAISASGDIATSGGIFSVGSMVSTTGSLRLPNNVALGWRNAANDGNMTLTLNSSNVFAFNGGVSATTLSLSGALTYGGVTLTAGVTGTGNMVLSASPTFTGTITTAAINPSGHVTLGASAQLTKSGEGTLATVKFGGVAGDPISTADGDMWLDTSGGNVKVKIGGAVYTLDKTAA